MSDVFDRIHRANALAIAKNDEEMVRRAFRDWAPKRLAWIVDHPRLLRLYLRLPHKARPVMLIYPDGRREMVLR